MKQVKSRGKKKQGDKAAHGAQRAAASTGSNPYEVFHNRKRHSAVLGERGRGEKRNVAKSRASAAASRTQNIVKDSLNVARTSQFNDKRLGEGKEGLGGVARLVKVRQRQAKKSFALKAGGADELTHGGRGLSSIPDEELKVSAEDDEDDDVGDGVADANDPIAASKRQREEAKREAEEQGRVLGELDTDYGSILGDLSFRPKKREALLAEKGEPDGYDMLVRTLGQERRAAAVDRTKTAEEAARERLEKLEALENARLTRAADADVQDAGDGGQDGAVGPEDAPGGQGGTAPADGEEGPDDEGEGEDSEAAGEEAEEESGESEAEQEEGGAEGGGAAAEGEAGEGEAVDDDDRQGERCASFLPARSEVDIMANEAGEAGLPFAPACPADRYAVDELLGTQAPRTCLKLVQRVRACTSVALGEANRKKLRGFFLALVDYVLHAIARSDGDVSARGLQVAYALRLPLVEMANENPEQAHEFFLNRLRSMDPGNVPRAAEFACLKLIALLFPATDFQHPIATPATVLADHWAAQIAGLGAGIEDLISDSFLLWEALYELVVPAQRFSGSFFQLGLALLESCLASADAGRSLCVDAATDVVRLLMKALRAIAEADPASARVAADELVRPVLRRVSGRTPDVNPASQKLHRCVSELGDLCGGFRSGGLAPLTLFEAAPPQIRVLDPIYHEEGDRGGRGSSELTATQLLKRQVTQARRSATRQLTRDAAVVQQLEFRKDQVRGVARASERKRVRTMMDNEKQEIKKMMTEQTHEMDTSLRAYSAGKEKKRANKRLGGNATAALAVPAGDKDKASGGAPRSEQFAAAAAAPGSKKGKKVPGSQKGKKAKKGKH